MVEEIKKKKGWHTIAAYLAVFYIVASFVQIGLLYGAKILSFDLEKVSIQNFLSSLSNFVTYLILFVALIMIQAPDLKTNYIAFKEKEKNKTVAIMGSFAIFYLISLVFQNLVLSIEENFNFAYGLMGITDFLNTTSDNQTVIEQMMNGPGAVFMFISAVILGPICEELVFRKAFFDIIEKPEIAIVISSLVFGSIHIFSSIGMYSALEIFLMTVPYVASGVALGYVYIRAKKNIWIPIIVHTLSNLISMLAIIGTMI